MKTIKQIAGEIGVSKQAVHQKIKKEPLSTALQPFTSTIDGVKHILVDGEKLIKQAFDTKSPSTVDVNEPSTVNDSLTVVDGAVIDILRENLSLLQAQLSEKDKQISNLSAQLDEERQHSREQSDKFAVLADQAQKLQLLTTNPEPPLAANEQQPPAAATDPLPARQLKRRFFGLFSHK